MPFHGDGSGEEKKGKHRYNGICPSLFIAYTLRQTGQTQHVAFPDYFKPRFFSKGSVPGSLPRKFTYISIASSMPPGVKTY